MNTPLWSAALRRGVPVPTHDVNPGGNERYCSPFDRRAHFRDGEFQDETIIRERRDPLTGADCPVHGFPMHGATVFRDHGPPRITWFCHGYDGEGCERGSQS